MDESAFDEILRGDGGALFRRLRRLLTAAAPGDLEARVEGLLVRLIVHARAGADAGARWRWVYRVATSHALGRLAPDARPGGGTAGADGNGDVDADVLPPMRELRRLDEVAQAAVVLARLDGLDEAEIAGTLALPPAAVHRALARAARTLGVGAGANAAAGGGRASHPSALALDTARAAHDAHLAACARCRAFVAEADARQAEWEQGLTPARRDRVARAVRAERARLAARPRWTRALWMFGATLGICVLALAVARPQAPARDATPYAGRKGASRATAAGLRITVRHGEELRALRPDDVLAAGDRLSFRVRADEPRYLELRLRDGAGVERRLFPVTGAEAARVRPDETLAAATYVLDPPAGSAPATGAGGAAGAGSNGRLWIVGLFADHPFPLDRPPAADIEIVPIPLFSVPALAAAAASAGSTH